MEGSQWLNKTYNDLKKPETISDLFWWSNQEVPRDPTVRIQKYLDIFTQVINWPNHEERQKALDAIKEALYSHYIIKPENVPESVFELEQKAVYELTSKKVPITQEFKDAKIQNIISNQTTSLNQWVDYLTGPDAFSYPDWAKYWAIRSVLGMGKLSKSVDDKGNVSTRFERRNASTVSSFPLLNQRALTETISVMKSKLKLGDTSSVTNTSKQLTKEDFTKLISTENFSKIYAQFLIELPAYTTEGLQETRGKWVKFNQGSDARPLTNSMIGYPLEWCTANYDTATQYLSRGDFYMYYSFNEDNEPVIPRVAISTAGGKITEVRGIAPRQHLDPFIAPVIEEKMKEFPDGAMFQKKAHDMENLAEIENKINKEQQLTKTDLIFLYEIDSKIEGFGYGNDLTTRIQKLRSKRNTNEDALIVLDCTKEQVATQPSHITKETKAYIGPLQKGIFELLKKYNITHVYTSFPEGKLQNHIIVTGGKSKSQLENEIDSLSNNISDYSKKMMEVMAQSKDFKESEKNKSQELELVELSVADLGFPQGATRQEIYKRALELGLQICPAEVGPQLRVQYQNQPLNNYLVIGMEPIKIDSSGNSQLFLVYHYDDGRYLVDSSDVADYLWDSGYRFVFVRGK